MQQLNSLKLAIKKALLRLNNGESVSDFLAILKDECKNLSLNIKDSDTKDSNEPCLATLQKALLLLKERNIIDFSLDLPLTQIDSKLSSMLQINKVQNLSSPKNILSLLNPHNAKKEILLCKISEKNFIKKLDSITRQRLLETLCELFIKSLDKKSIIGIYKDCIVIFPKIYAKTSHKIAIDAVKSEILQILQSNTFMLNNKPLLLQMDFEIKKFGELK